MDENGTYSWPGNQPQKPRKKTDFKRVGRTILVVALALILLPMTASRMVFSLCGFVILAVGGGMLAERVWEKKNREDDDPNIIDAL